MMIGAFSVPVGGVFGLFVGSTGDRILIHLPVAKISDRVALRPEDFLGCVPPILPHAASFDRRLTRQRFWAISLAHSSAPRRQGLGIGLERASEADSLRVNRLSTVPGHLRHDSGHAAIKC
jgi:hypothetical protein